MVLKESLRSVCIQSGETTMNKCSGIKMDLVYDLSLVICGIILRIIGTMSVLCGGFI